MTVDAMSPASDFDQIVQRTFAYAIALDTKAWDALAVCFTPDGILRTSFAPNPLLGHAAIKQGMDRITVEIVGNLHQTTNHQYVVEGDEASGTCMFVAYQWVGDSAVPGNLRVHGGRYQDRLVRRDGVWLFADRFIDLQCQRVF